MGRSGVNWNNVAHESILGQINGGAGVAPVSDAASGYQRIADTLREADQDLRAALGSVGASWEGRASSEMRTAATPLAMWADEADQLANRTSAATDLFGGQFADTRSAMPPVVNVPSGSWVDDTGLSGLPGVTTDRERAEEAADAAQQEAARRMEAYDNASYETVRTQYFSAPPAVVLEVPPPAPAGGPTPTGTGATPSGGADGTAHTPGGSVAAPPSATSQAPRPGQATSTTQVWTPPPGTTSPAGSPPVNGGPLPGGGLPPGQPGGGQPGPFPPVPPGYPTYPGGPGGPGYGGPGSGPVRPGLPGGPGSGPGGLGSGPGGVRPGLPSGPGSGGPGLGGRWPGGPGSGFGPGNGFGGHGAGFGGPGGSAGFGGPGGPGGLAAGAGGPGQGGFGGQGGLGGALVDGERGVAGRGVAGGAAGAGGYGPMAGGARGDDDSEHRRPDYLVETEDIWGDGVRVAPPVIGAGPG